MSQPDGSFPRWQTPRLSSSRGVTRRGDPEGRARGGFPKYQLSCSCRGAPITEVPSVSTPSDQGAPHAQEGTSTRLLVVSDLGSKGPDDCSAGPSLPLPRGPLSTTSRRPFTICIRCCCASSVQRGKWHGLGGAISQSAALSHPTVGHGQLPCFRPWPGLRFSSQHPDPPVPTRPAGDSGRVSSVPP